MALNLSGTDRERINAACSEDGDASARRRRDENAAAIWVVDIQPGTKSKRLLGDARRVADELGARVGAIVVGSEPASLIAHGADLVVQVVPHDLGACSLLAAVERILRRHPVRLVYSGRDPDNRAMVARLAVRQGWLLVSPAVVVQARDGELTITALDAAERKARRLTLPREQVAVAVLRHDVAQSVVADPGRVGTIVQHQEMPTPELSRVRRRISVDPATADIRHVRRLVCGGRGVGGADGFARLERIARRLDAGVAASRVAVDLGWIGYERQVGQTGKTVTPDVYIGCGVRGASHHLEGMSQSEHIIAINTDPDAPLLKRAHLALVADLHQVLSHLEQALDDHRP